VALTPTPARSAADGTVRFTSDFCLLHRADGGSERVLVDVCNRGRKIAVKDFNLGTSAAVQRESEPGDGFLFRQGLAVLSVGWQWDTYSSDSLLGLEAPLAPGGEANSRPTVYAV
jgi:hypothetical protein